MSGELLIVTGPPGAGKSTVATRLAGRHAPSALVEGDAFFGFLREGRIEPWLVESRAQNEMVTEAAAACAGRFAREAWTVYDGVIGPWFLPTFMAATGLGTAHYVILLPSVERCLHGVATRIGHGFTDAAATRHMHDEFAKASIEPRHVLRDPSGDVDAVVELIVQGVGDGSLLL